MFLKNLTTSDHYMCEFFLTVLNIREIKTKNYTEILPHSSQNYHYKQLTTNTWEDVGEWIPYT